jgi:hypothetical protein
MLRDELTLRAALDGVGLTFALEEHVARPGSLAALVDALRIDTPARRASRR